MVTEKRKQKRRMTGQRAWVDFGRGWRIQQCVVKDMSDRGACLTLAIPPQMPHEFLLHLSPDGSVSRRCLLRWRAGMEMGVQFTARITHGRRSDYAVLDC